MRREYLYPEVGLIKKHGRAGAAHIMDFSFPCVGKLNDGIFDLGLEDDSYDEAAKSRKGRQAADSSPSEWSSRNAHQSIVLSPDALDLALMAYNVGEEEEERRGGVDGERSGDVNASVKSPFCDTSISSKGHKKNNKGPDPSVSARTDHQASSFDNSTSPKSTDSSCISGGAGQSQAHHEPSAPRMSPARWPPARERRGGARAGGARDISNAFPPRQPEDDLDGESVAVSAGTSRLVAAAHRGTKARLQQSCRIPGGNMQHKSCLADVASAKSRWARQRAATCEAAVVESSVRREEEALAEANGTANVATAPPAACPSSRNTSGKKKRKCSMQRITATGVGSAGERRRVSFASEFPGCSKEECDEDNDGEWNKTSNTRVMPTEDGEQSGDLLARASELHSSVAGQLRSVNELLKRKSYFYIDTSWSAKQLPCPPTAWRGRGVGVEDSATAKEGVTGGTGVGVGVEVRAGSRNSGTSSTANSRPVQAATTSPDASNVVVRLDGRWVSAASKKPKVGVHSIPGEKAHDPSWKNQDAGLVIAPLDRRERQALFAIFDGHGTNGRHASRECMERLPKYFVSATRSGNPASALRRACQRLHHDLAAGVAGDCTRSGTTLCAAVLTGRRLTVANVGDSGCLRLSRRTAAAASTSPGGVATSPAQVGLTGGCGESDGVVAGAAEATSRRRRLRTAENMAALGTGDAGAGGSREGLTVERLSRDHKPESKGELERIQAAGGIVFPLPKRCAGGVTDAALPPAEVSKQGLTTARDLAAGIPRVWTASGNGPGLAMSRSIGDKMAHSVGVTFEPEITEFDLDPRSDTMLILASDGVWDVLSAEDVRQAAEVHAVDDSWCPQALSADICRKSLSEWADAYDGSSDDITCLIVKTLAFLPPLPPTTTIMTSTRRTSSSAAVTAADTPQEGTR